MQKMLHGLDLKLSPSFWLLVLVCQSLLDFSRTLGSTGTRNLFFKNFSHLPFFNLCCSCNLSPPTRVPVLSSAPSIFFFSSCAVEAFEEVSDSLCVPQYNADGEERVILFLKMAPGKPFSADLVGKIKGAIRKALSARHVPALLLETKDIPVRGTININQIVHE